VSPLPTPPPDWSPRLWQGLDYFAFLRLMARARFRVGPGQLYIAGIMSVTSFANTASGWVQQGWYGRRLRGTPLPESPVFVLGHWRSGTTLLHELLMLDTRFTCPTTHDCFLPCHNLLSGEFVRANFGFAMPGKRPMDNMPAGWDRPQEDEFALALLGEPSTYTDVAFPNDPPLDPGALDLSGLSPRQVRHWQRTLARFIKTIAMRDPRRLVLKSPPHTARVPELLELFPAAKFVHIGRDPYALFGSTVNLWLALSKAHGLQTPRGPQQFEEKVFREFRVLTERYLATRDLIPAGNLVEVRFDELTADMPGTVGRVYQALGLDGYPAIEPLVAGYAAATKSYERNKFELPAETRARIRERWGDLIERTGYG